MPKKVDEYAKSVREKNPDYDEARVWATAWSIYCKHKNPNSPSCKKDRDEYLPNQGKGKKAMSERTAALQDGPLGRVFDEYWNTLHDFESDLEKVVQEYDMASSYRGGPGQRDAQKVMRAVQELKKSLEAISMRTMQQVWKLEDDFIKTHGDPSDYVVQQRNEMFPRAASETSSLRSDLIRLAHENPELRGDLLPLLKEARAMSKGESMRWMNQQQKKHGGRTKAYYQAVLDAVEKREIAPSAVVGGGYKDGRKVAIQWLKDQMKSAKTAAVPDELRSLLKGEWVEVNSQPVVAVRYWRGSWGAIMRNGLVNSYMDRHGGWTKLLYQMKNSMQVPPREANRAIEALVAKVGG